VSEIAERLKLALADRYRIERELGAGGMATVFLAEDLKHDRKVALKILKPELAAVLGADRFIQEIKTTASLQHPHRPPPASSTRTSCRSSIRGKQTVFSSTSCPTSKARRYVTSWTAKRSSGSTRPCASRARWPMHSITRTGTG
jgi:serine/threonine protein kinase